MRRCLYTLVCIVAGLLFSKISFAQVIANFTANVTSGCSPILVQFTDLSTGGATSWSWNLGNGTTSTLQNPSTTYIQPGTYTVTLTASNSSGSNTKTVAAYINVVASPSVNFVVNDSTLSCPPKTVQFTNLSVPGTAGTATYLWDFGDGTTSAAVNPSHTYTTGGNYNVTLSVTNSSGCSRTFTKNQYVKVSQKPEADFTATNNNACSLPATVVFTNSTAGGQTYNWSFGTGATSTAANPTYTYTSGGSYAVTLIATNTNGCKDTIVKSGFVNIGPLTAAFTKSTAAACINTPISFTNTTTPGAGNSTWYFGDGTSSNVANPTKSYTAAGTYTVKLVVNYSTCSDSTTQTVVIHPSPDAQFTANPANWCSAPKLVQFNNTSTGASSYLWKFGTGATATSVNPSYTYTALGSYDVTLIATSINGCKDTLVQPAYINLAPPTVTVTSTPIYSCAPSNISFTANVQSNQPIITYTWDFGDGTTASGGPNINHTYNTHGTYIVTVTITTASGCTATSPAYVTLIGAPTVAGFTANPMTICPGQTVTFTNTTTSANGTPSYNWYFGDGGTSTAANPTHTYLNQGTYTVTLYSGIDGCITSYSQTIIVNPPLANFNHTYFCNDRKKVAFTSTSQGGTSLSWDFGDGTTSTATNPTHNYANWGIYQVTLTVVNAPTGCTAVTSRQIHVYPIDAQFTAAPTTVCKKSPVTFTAVADTTLVNYIWNFGDGNFISSPAPSVTHVYQNSGIYTVRLIVTDSHGCNDTLIRTNYITVNGPNVNFTGTPTSGCSPLLVNFTDQTTSSAGIASRTWLFGDGSSATATGTNINHTYTSLGSFNVTLIVADPNGCKDTLVKPGYITSAKPDAVFSVTDTSVCKGESVSFVNSSTGAGLTYQWNFGDGTTSTAANPTHVYTQPGVYSVRLVATSAGTCTDTMIRTGYIHVNGVFPGFTMSDSFATCPPLTVSFQDTSNGAGSTWWAFGNGNTSSLPNPTTVYSMPDTYTVKLYALDEGCIDSATKTVTVLGPSGTFSYTPTSGCVPLTVTFNSVNTNTQLLIWDMNNGVTQSTTASSTSYTYSVPGNYLPVLLLSDGASCIIPVMGTDTIKVGSITGDFSFSPVNVCQSGNISFNDTLLTPGVQVTGRSWSFGDGGTSTAQDPIHFYAAPGTYTVTLVLTSGTGCLDTISKQVTILQPPTVSGGNNANICQGQSAPVQLQASGAQTYLWSPAAGLSCTSCPNPQATPLTTTTYTVIGTAANGCLDTAQVTVTVDPLPVITTGTNPSICAGSSVQLAAAGATAYTWTPATGLSCTSCSNPVAAPSGTTTYTVTGTNVNGCSSTAQVTVTVNQNPAVNAGMTGGALCAGSSAQLQASGGVSYTWFPATGLSCTTCANPTATPSATTTYIVQGTNAAGCTDTAAVTVPVNSLPQVSAGTTQNICLGGSAQLQASGATTYTWSPSTGLSCTSCPNPVATPMVTTTYTVTGVDANGCANTAQVTVNVNALPVVSAGPDQTICEGAGAQLLATGAAGYNWAPATGLSCTNCANPTASPLLTTTYTVTGNSASGCPDTAQVTVYVNPLPQINAGQDVSICRLGQVQLQASGGISYSWTPGSSLSCITCPDPVANPVTATIYTVTGIDANGCSNQDQVTVNIYPDAVIDAGPDQTVCAGGQVQLSAAGGQTYTWTPANGLSCVQCPDPTFIATDNASFMVTGIDANGCVDSDMVNITVIQKNPYSFGSNAEICVGASVNLFANGGDSYEWLPASGLSSPNASNPIATPETTTEYMVIIRQGNCFTDTGIVTIKVHPVPTVDAGGDQTIIAGNSVTLFANATHTDHYRWTPAEDLSCNTCQSPDASPKKTTTYTVSVSNNFGCEAKDDVTIFIKCDNSQVFLPNTFTPNGDGNNDRFVPQGKGVGVVRRFRIFNRWGETIYDVENLMINDENRGWDGTYKGEAMKPDVYVYVVDALCETGEPMQIKGDISLIR